MIYNIEKLTSAEEMNVLSFASKRKRRDEMKQEKQVSFMNTCHRIDSCLQDEIGNRITNN